MTEGLSYSIPAMQTGFEAVTSAVAKLQQEHDSLTAQLQPMGTAWEGQGQESWAAVQSRWNASTVEMIGVLQQIGRALSNSMEIYNTNERGIVGAWNG